MSEYIELLQRMKEIDNQLNTFDSLNHEVPLFRFGRKLVFQEKENIYKVEDLYSGMRRILVIKYAISRGLTCFLDPIIVPELSGSYWITTKEPTINVITNLQDDNEILTYLDNEQANLLKNFMTITGAMGFTHNNCGLLNNNLYIYDFIDNCSCDKLNGQWRLNNSQMETLFNWKE